MRSHNDVDYSQGLAAPADDEDDPLKDPLIDALRRLAPGLPLWSDPEALRQYRDELHDMILNKSRDTSPEENRRLRQETQEEAILSREADDKFWGSKPEEWWKNQRRKL
jgi:hypothetical protein